MTVASALRRVLISFVILAVAASFGHGSVGMAVGAIPTHHADPSSSEMASAPDASVCGMHAADEVPVDGGSSHQAQSCCGKACVTMLMHEPTQAAARSDPLTNLLRPEPDIDRDGRGPTGPRRPPR